MEIFVKATLIDDAGWQKQYDLPEGIFWVGSAQKAHLRLPQASGVAPYVLQVVNSLGETSLRLINLSPEDIQYQNGEVMKNLAAGSVVDIFGGELFRIGSYQLKFLIDKPIVHKEITQEEIQTKMGARLILSDVVLRPEEILVGKLLLQNLGDEACQFEVAIDGVPEGCYEISPPPLIYGGGEESMEIRLFHRKTAPPAGSLGMTLHVSAGEVYPGEDINIQQTIKVVPYYEHSLSFIAPEVIEEPAIPFIEPNEIAMTSVLEEAEASYEDDVDKRIARYATSTPEDETAQVSTVVQLEPTYSQETVPSAGISQAQPEVDTAEQNSSDQTKPVKSTELEGPGEATTKQPLVDSTGENRPRKSKRPDLSAIKVMKASSGDFLEKKD